MSKFSIEKVNEYKKNKIIHKVFHTTMDTGKRYKIIKRNTVFNIFEITKDSKYQEIGFKERNTLISEITKLGDNNPKYKSTIKEMLSEDMEYVFTCCELQVMYGCEIGDCPGDVKCCVSSWWSWYKNKR